MVDNRSAGHFGIGGAFNFKSGSISGTAANLSDDKMGQGGEYANLRKGEPEESPHAFPYMDRSAILRATLNSLAMMNVADVINNKRSNAGNTSSAKDESIRNLNRVLAVSQEQSKNQHEKNEDDSQESHDEDDFDFVGELD